MIRAALLLLLLTALPARAAGVLVAVASNFAEPAGEIAAGFEAATGHRVILSAGATGALYARIVNGAPYDVLLAADAERPARLEAEGRAVPGSRFTYAVGRLVLWSPDPERIADGPAAIAAMTGRLAIAHPDLAPYGAAAAEMLAALGLDPPLVRGENVGQAYALVATGNAELGLVAAAQLRHGEGSRWLVPADLHAPIRQDAVLLRDGPAARAFLDWLRGPEAAAVIAAWGYEADGR